MRLAIEIVTSDSGNRGGGQERAQEALGIEDRKGFRLFGETGVQAGIAGQRIGSEAGGFFACQGKDIGDFMGSFDSESHPWVITAQQNEVMAIMIPGRRFEAESEGQIDHAHQPAAPAEQADEGRRPVRDGSGGLGRQDLGDGFGRDPKAFPARTADEHAR